MIPEARSPSCSVCHSPTLFGFKNLDFSRFESSIKCVVVPETAKEHILPGQLYPIGGEVDDQLKRILPSYTHRKNDFSKSLFL